MVVVVSDSSLFDSALRLPPSNVAAECALLGTLLSNNRSFNAVSAFLRPEMFIAPENSRVFQAIARRLEGGLAVDAITLKAEFEHAGVLEYVGGVTYLTQLLAAMVSPTLAGDYGRAIHDTWARRQLIELGEAMIANAYGSTSDIPAVEQIAMIQDEFAALESAIGSTDGAPPKGVTTTAYDAFLSAVERAEGMSRGEIARPFSTGLPAVDRMIGGGISPDNLLYMVGAGGAGKTELALQIAESVAAEAYNAWVAGGQDGPCPAVLYIMLGNMTARQLGARTAARSAEMRLAPIRRGTIDMEQAARLVQAGGSVAKLPLEISDTGPATVARVLGDMRRVSKRRPLVLTIVDNFSDILSGVPDKMFGTAIAATQALKMQGATATQSAVLLLMHLNSSVENSQSRSARPRPSDIPWGTKKDADGAFGIWRPIKYMPSEAPTFEARSGKKVKLSADGQELEAKLVKEWSDKREPWPIGVADITEIVPMKLREEDESSSDSIAKIRFDRNFHRFIDVKAERSASPLMGSEEDAF